MTEDSVVFTVARQLVQAGANPITIGQKHASFVHTVAADKIGPH
jgi:hypothetical protein